MPLLETRDLGVRRGDAWVLRGISFTLDPGESLGVIGESGSGKTTLAWAVLGLLDPAEGEVLLEDRPWSARGEGSRRARRPALQAVFQDCLGSLPPHLRGWEILEEPLRIQGRGGRAERREAAARMAARVRFPIAALDQRPAQWSGGLGQRLALGRALMLEPRLLVLDEPVSALDPTLAQHQLDLLGTLRAEGLSLLLVSHHLGAVSRLCDRVLLLHQGEPLALGTVDEVRRHPYAEGLWEALPDLEGGGLRRWGVETRREVRAGACGLASRCPLADGACEGAPAWTHGIRCHHPLQADRTVSA
jgi:peptide/nickel transport system ATP-binding protein